MTWIVVFRRDLLNEVKATTWRRQRNDEKCSTLVLRLSELTDSFIDPFAPERQLHRTTPAPLSPFPIISLSLSLTVYCLPACLAPSIHLTHTALEYFLSSFKMVEKRRTVGARVESVREKNERSTTRGRDGITDELGEGRERE